MQKLFTVFDDEINLYFVQEFVPVSSLLQEELGRCRRIGEKDCGVVFRQLIDFCHFMHGEGYLHRDFKTIGIAKLFQVVKIVDFSWVTAIRFKKQPQFLFRQRDTFCGSYKQAPPELLDGSFYDQSVDSWCLGTLLYEMSTGMSPFENGSQSQDLDCLNFPISMSVELVNLLGKLLTNKEDRLGVEQICGEEWVKMVEIDELASKQIWTFWTRKH